MRHASPFNSQFTQENLSARRRVLTPEHRSICAASSQRALAPEHRNDLASARRAVFEKRRKRRRAAETSAWVFDDSADGVFSFQNVCDVLGIDGEALRARVRDSNPYTELSLKRILSPAPGKYHR